MPNAEFYTEVLHPHPVSIVFARASDGCRMECCGGSVAYNPMIVGRINYRNIYTQNASDLLARPTGSCNRCGVMYQLTSYQKDEVLRLSVVWDESRMRQLESTSS